MSVQNDVSELTKILDDILCFKITIDYYVTVLSDFEVGILNEFLDDWVENSVEIPALGEPRSARETQCWIGVFQEVDHVVECDVFLAMHFG